MLSSTPRFLALALVSLCACLAHDVAAHPDILRGASVYIEPISGNVDGLLAAEIVKLDLPFVLTQNRNNADYIIGSVSGFSAVSSSVPKEGQSFDGAIAMIDAQTRRVVWIGDAGGSKRPKAPRKSAAKLIQKMRKDLFGSPSISDRIDDLLHP